MKKLYFLLSALYTIKNLSQNYSTVNCISYLFIWLFYDTVSPEEVM